MSEASKPDSELSVVLETLLASFGTERVFVVNCCGNLYVGIVAPGNCKRCQRPVVAQSVDLSVAAEKQAAIDNLK